MRIVVEPVIGRTLSNLIAMTYGPVLDIRGSDIIDYCQKMGEVYAGYIDGELICVWGLIPPSFLSIEAYLWMWCADDMVEHQLIFIRQSQIQIKRMLQRYATINGHCMTGSRKAIRWLKWLGAEFTDYPDGDKYTFTIRRKA